MSYRLRALARTQDVSLFAMVLSGWIAVLGRCTGQQDMLLGVSGAHGRSSRSGFHDGVVTGRFQFDDGATAEQLVHAVHAAIEEAVAGGNVADKRERAAPQAVANPQVHPHVLILLDRETLSERDGLQQVQLSATTQTALAITHVDRGYLTCALDYAAELFDRETVEDLLSRWRLLLHAMTKHPRRPIGQLGMLTAAERARVLRQYNDTAAIYPRDKLIHQLFEHQVQRVPSAIALMCLDCVLTYSELNRRCNCLARYLRERGVRPGDRVAICVERSVDTVVAVLGTLKSGAAYVPMDPSYPPERLSYVLEDAKPAVVLTQSWLARQLPSSDIPTVCLDVESTQISCHDTDDLGSVGLTGDALAYIIYTSGSTGQPKGVMVRHRNVVNYATYAAKKFDVEAGKGSLIGTSLSFDLALTGFFPPLLCGRALRLCGDEEDLSQCLLSGSGYAPVKLTPTHLSMLSLPEDRIRGCIRTLVIGGELLQGHALRWWRAHSPGTRIFNHYGPTETTIGCVVHEVLVDVEGPVPIGRPIANTQIYILNAYRQPVPVGVVGEIYIGGDGVAAGYWNRPELTAERFLRDPFSSDPSARIYRSGDLGRWQADGTIEYLGRSDDQVKVRGFRIELGEIGARLVEHGQVKEAVVVVREETPEDKRLIAYVTPRQREWPTPEALRAHARTVLPDYMVPSAFVVLSHLPVTPNGKLDKRALPAPQADAYATATYEAPQTALEQKLGGLWQDLLRVERVGRHDNFFELGGHSLLVVQLMERIRRLGLLPDVRSIYTSPTLQGFALALADSAAPMCAAPPNRIPRDCESIVPEMLPLIDLKPEHIEKIVDTIPGGARNIQDIYPLAPLQEGILFHHLFRDTGGDTYVLPTLISVASRARLHDLRDALQAVIDRHDVLRSAVLWRDLPRPVQVVHREARLAMEEIELDAEHNVEEQLRAWMAPERQRIDLTVAPLLRLRIAADPRGSQWYAILQAHHIVSDHESTAKMLREVMVCLRGESQALPVPRPYREHVAQVLAHAQSHDAEKFFRTKLEDVDEPTLPFGLVDVRGGGGSVDESQEALDPAFAARVRSVARRLRVSAATLFHAAWALLVGCTSGRDDVVFGTLLLGRMQSSVGAQELLGMFINTLPLRIRLRGLTARDLVERIQGELIELLGHEQASLAQAQRCSAIGGSAPLFSALLNYVHGTLRLDSDHRQIGAGVEILARREWTNYPVVVSVEDRPDTFVLTAQTDRRIDPRRLTTYLRTVTQSLVIALEHAPHTAALKLHVLPEEERRRVVEEFNATRRAYPAELPIHEIFQEWARKTPDAPALVCGAQRLTYSTLNERANRLARYLCEQGVHEGEYVVILMERSFAQVIAQIAILKCGCVYVPVDPTLPDERQALMISDCGAQRILVDSEDDTPTVAGSARRISLESAESAAAHLSAANLAAPAHRHPAYVMYTSGSTGTPKGVLVTQPAVVRLVINNGYAEIVADDCVAYCSNPTFDAATFEVWGALLNGAQLLVVPQSVLLEVRRFAELLERHRATILFLTVGLFVQCADALAAVFSRLRYLLTGGDVVDPAILRRVLRSSPPQCLLAAYGPTECTTFTTTFRVQVLDESVTAIPIGRPIGNATIHILNHELAPVAIGAVGEIYIGGAGVALGYLNRPELTAQRFVADPFATDPDAKLYKTGDLGRWRADGNVEFLGRNDQQVKVRGFRIELGEIESQLVRHPQVREAAVIVRHDENGGKRLIAYVATRSGGDAGVEALRDHLRRSMPEYMIPAAFVSVPRLPLTPNGKLDRRALPEPDLAAYSHRQYEAPRGMVERVVAGIWMELLNLERIGRHDHFFDLGGHSLLAMQTMVRLRSSLSLELPISVLFDHPLLSDFAAALDARREAQLAARIERGGTELDELLERVASMQEHEVHEMMSKLTAGVRP